MIGLFQSHPIIDPARIRGKRLYWILVSDWLIHYHKRLFWRPLTRPGKYLTRPGKYCAVIGRKPVLKPVWLSIILFLTTDIHTTTYGRWLTYNGLVEPATQKELSLVWQMCMSAKAVSCADICVWVACMLKFGLENHVVWIVFLICRIPFKRSLVCSTVYNFTRQSPFYYRLLEEGSLRS